LAARSNNREPKSTSVKCRLTLPSRGTSKGYRPRPPLMSNVSRLVSQCEASVSCPCRCACVHRRLKVVCKAVPLLHPIGGSGAGCPSVGGQRTALLHRASRVCLEPRRLAGRVLRTPPLGFGLFRHRLRPCRGHLRSCQAGAFAPTIQATLRFSLFWSGRFAEVRLSRAVLRVAWA
jgi:hypothetical protein